MDYIRDRQLKICLLEIAKQKIAASREFYICNALAWIPIGERRSEGLREYSYMHIYDAAYDLRAYIMHAIAPYETYPRWALNNRDEKYSYTPRANNPALGRLAWIDWMIACYEEDITNYKKENHG